MHQSKHIFLINAHAVTGKKKKLLTEKIMGVCRKHQADYRIYETDEMADIARCVTEEKEQNFNGRTLRFYACGGDGTLNQVANAVYRDANAQVGVIPLGTGNDFVKSFTNSKYFMDIERQIFGKAVLVDAIAYGENITVNMINIGFDCMVVAKTQQTKKWPFMKGPAAYLAAVAIVLKDMPLSRQRVVLDGKEVAQDVFLLTVIANGSYCGGGFNAASKAVLNDGYADVLLVDPVSRTKFLSLVGMYKKGTLLDDKRAEEVLKFQRCRKVEIISEEKTIFCSDGEIFPLDKIAFSVVPKAIRFLMPAGCQLKNEN